MRTGGKTALTVRGACLAAGLTFFLGIAQADIPIQIVMSDGAISIRADNSSIRSVLEELSRHTNLIVISDDALDELVTVEIDQRTLPETIRRLLRHKSFMLHELRYTSGHEYRGITPFSRLWIFSSESYDSQHALTTQPNYWPDHGSDNEMVDYQILALSDDVADREEAMYGFSVVDSKGRIGYLQQGLTDPDDRVREAAIESLAELGGADSVRALSVVLNDPDAGIRMDVVDALGETGGREAIELLQQAMTDENHNVREGAAEWLTELAWQQD